MTLLTPHSGTANACALSPMTETWQTVTTLATPFTIDGRDWNVRVEGSERDDGTWAGRIVFSDGTVVRTTDRETSQPNRDALGYWATGLEQVYLEGALRRAR